MSKGVYDSTLKKYNDATPNYDKEDGVDIVKYTDDCKNCKYADTVQDRCLFETCIRKLYPISIPFHTRFYTKCKLCNSTMCIVFSDGQHPFTDIPNICDKCESKLKKLINSVGDD